MGRPPGFNFFDPGYLSVTIPYHDISDFYFSGHVGVLMLYASEYYCVGYKKMSYLTCLVAVTEWYMLVVTRAHFIIDFTTAIPFALMMNKISEKVCYLTDVKGFGYQKHNNRSSFHYNPCDKCGWCNGKPEKYLSNSELELQLQLV